MAEQCDRLAEIFNRKHPHSVSLRRAISNILRKSKGTIGVYSIAGAFVTTASLLGCHPPLPAILDT